MIEYDKNIFLANDEYQKVYIFNEQDILRPKGKNK